MQGWRKHVGKIVVLAGVLWSAAAPSTAAQGVSTESVSAQEEVHVVRRGESLSEIARDHGTTIATLQRLNNLTNIDVIPVGMALTLPAGEAPLGALLEENELVMPHSVDEANILLDDAREDAVEIREDETDAAPDLEATGEEIAAEEGNKPETTAETIHVVARGEHLGILAARYNISAAAIIEANALEDANIIVPGQRLVIPPPSSASSEAEVIDNARDSEDPSAATPRFHQHERLPEGLTEQDEKWIDVDLSEQQVVAYEGLEIVETFTVSTGLPGTPTVQGEFRIWAKTPLQDMYGGNRAAGDYYYLEDVPWVQYFYEDYAFHGATWHMNFGQPMSRGCVNMQVEDAKWLFEWAGPPMALDATGWLFSDTEVPGTFVVVHE